jgi:DNA-binding transcriptional LysR family regulator
MVGLLRSDETYQSVIELVDEPYVMLVPANHHLAGLTSVQPEQLAAEVMIARRSCEILNETSRFFTRHQVRPRFSFRSDSDDRCIQMVAAGLGITTAPASLKVAGTFQLLVTGYDFRRRVGVRLGSNMDGVAYEKLRFACEAYIAVIQHTL